MTKPLDQKDLDSITKSIELIGGDVKALKESHEKDLKIARDEVTAVKKQFDELDPIVQEKVSKAVESSLQAFEKVEKVANEQKERIDQLETAIKRKPQGADMEEKELKGARRFFHQTKALKGELKGGVVFNDEHCDFTAYKSYCQLFSTLLRKGEMPGMDAKALSIGSDPDGGYYVPDAVSQRILTQVYESSPIRQYATVESIGTDALVLPVDENEAAANWVGEQESRAETNTPTVGQERIPVHEMYAKPKATQQFLEDAAIDAEGWLARKVADKFMRLEATGFVTGDGINKPRGILDYPAGTSRGQIQQAETATSNTLIASEVQRHPFYLKEYYHSNARWFMNRLTVQAVMLLLDGDNNFIWQNNFQQGMPATLVGYPVVMAADVPAKAAGALSLVFGDMRAAYTIVDRVGISTLRDPYSSKPFVEFYSRKRVGGAVTTFEALKIIKIKA